MVSLRRHFVPNPVAIDSTGFQANRRTSLFFHTRYDAYGKATVYNSLWTTEQSPDLYKNPTLYTGRYRDLETLLFYFRARYYDVALSRFINRDPIGYRGGTNLYEYVGDSPLMYMDLSGLQKLPTLDTAPRIRPTPPAGVHGSIILACMEACGLSAANAPGLGTVTNNACFQHCIGSKTTKRGEGIPIPLDGSAPTETQRKCCQEYSGRESSLGVALCCEAKPLICLYDGNFISAHRFEGVGKKFDPLALQIIRLGVITHERTHHTKIVCTCKDKYPGAQHLTIMYVKPGFRESPAREGPAYLAEWKYLVANRALCQSNATCTKQVDIAIEAARRGAANSLGDPTEVR